MNIFFRRARAASSMAICEYTDGYGFIAAAGSGNELFEPPDEFGASPRL